MANNSKAYTYFIGFAFAELPFLQRAEVADGMLKGYLRIDAKGFVRSAK